VSKNDIPLVGGKGANLGELTNANIPVPPGFIVTADAYFDFLQETGISGKIRQILGTLDSADSKQLQEIAARTEQVILDSPMPPKLAEQIKQAYIKMGRGLVAVRSSATAEDLPEASFAGQQSTFLNVRNEEEVVVAVQKCWASLYTPRSIFYREQQGFDHFKVGLAVPVQRMVQALSSGVMFTIEPITNDNNIIAIEAVFGLGEAIVSGEVIPDLYLIDKDSLKIESKKIAKQDWQLVLNPAGNAAEPNIRMPVPPSRQREQKISDEEVIKIAKMGKQIEDWYKFPQDIEWAKDANQVFIVQSRPVTTIKEITEVEPEIKAPVLITGTAASPGMASGPVKVISEASQIGRVESGAVLVTQMTTPDFVPAMKRVAAIVTDQGGRTAHAAIVSRELGIPCVVGTEHATTTLSDGQIVTVDGSRGKIYEGKAATERMTIAIDVLKEAIKTKTRVYVNLAEPELAESIAARNVDGVGLLRAEFMIAQIGEHPRYVISQNRTKEFVDKVAKGLITFTQAFNPRPVVYRTNDFKTNEYRRLTGGQQYEEVEENPMIGYRGAFRYSLEPDIFKLEIEAIKKVRQEYNNLWVMIPFVRTVSELEAVKSLMEAEGLKRSDDFKLWTMVEVPSNIFLLEKFIEVGIDGISIGSNDLTQLILGVDRDSSRMAIDFDERNEAVLIAMERAVKVSKSMGITSSICGQAPSVYPELTEKLVEWGITSVSISPDMIGTTREIIAVAEKRLSSNEQAT